jgi:heme exporter protein C
MALSGRGGILVGVTLVAILVAQYAALLYAPTERIQRDAQRIFYLHVPLAWTAYLAFFVVFVASIAYLKTRREWWDALARGSAEVGLLLTTLMIVTGSLWARPIWGTWWSWDARLTTTLVLWFIYVAHLMLGAVVPEERKAARFRAVLGIIGFIDIPIIHQSVVWWRTLHPQSVVLAPEGPALPFAMLAALALSLVAFTLLYTCLVHFRVQIDLTRADIRALRRHAHERVG